MKVHVYARRGYGSNSQTQYYIYLPRKGIIAFTKNRGSKIDFFTEDKGLIEGLEKPEAFLDSLYKYSPRYVGTIDMQKGLVDKLLTLGRRSNQIKQDLHESMDSLTSIVNQQLRIFF